MGVELETKLQNYIFSPKEKGSKQVITLAVQLETKVGEYFTIMEKARRLWSSCQHPNFMSTNCDCENFISTSLWLWKLHKGSFPAHDHPADGVSMSPITTITPALDLTLETLDACLLQLRVTFHLLSMLHSSILSLLCCHQDKNVDKILL